MTKNNKIIHFALIGLIIVIAIVVRIYNIDSAPSGIYPDEANNGTNAYEAQLKNNYQWFYPDNNGREGLYLNFMALCFKFFDVSFFTLKLPSITMGVLTVIGVYFLSRELFISKPRIALFASYLTAVSFWAIIFSRIAFRAIIMLPILLFSFYFLFRGIRTNKWHHFAIAGFIFGLGFHTYIAFRIAPALLMVLLILFLIQNGKNFLKKIWKNLIIFILFAGISITPMIYTFHTHPEFLNSRTSDVSIFSQKDTPIMKTLTETISLSLMKYNFYGDQNWRHGYPPYPTLEFFAGILFISGFFISITSFFTYLYRTFSSNNQNKKFIIHGFLIAWFFAFLSPEFMTIESLPHNLRSIGTLPVVYIFTAFCTNFIIERSEMRSHALYITTSAITLTLLLWIGFFNIVKYHIYWSTEPAQAAAFNKDLTDIGKQIAHFPKDTKKYVIAGPMERLPIQLLNTQTQNVHYLYENELKKIQTNHDFYVLIPYHNDTIIDYLASKTKIAVEEIKTDLDTSFFVITPILQSTF
ncbi:MAG: hypothetical protein CR972_02850 [Candidatus Moraniibacteriota bacterium]|nr:MAG: hypothetical protein CR972_02850 [Candidatus Moranbacteria bacterium]